MRFKLIAGGLLAVFMLTSGLATPASAFGWHRKHPEGWGRERVVRHYVYYPRYKNRYYYAYRTDPYAYRYEPRGYYPYYKSHYWRPSYMVRRHRGFTAPRYYPAWGYYKRRYHHKRWHYRNHGRHPFWQW